MLETERTTLLIDAGLGRKEILRRFEALGRPQPERVDAILITHEHSDHSTAVAQLARLWDCPAYLTEPTHREIVKMYAEDPEKPGKKATIDRVEYIRAGKRFQIGDIEINPFAFRTTPQIPSALPSAPTAPRSRSSPTSAICPSL